MVSHFPNSPSMDSEGCLQIDSNEVCYDKLEDYINKFGYDTMGLRSLYINARSLRNKFSKVEFLLQRIPSVDVIVVSENWLTENDVKFYDIQNFNAHHVARKGMGGGISVYVSNKWAVTVKNVVNDLHSILNILISADNVTYNIIGIYNPQYQNSKKFLDDLEEILDHNILLNCLILGDFNIDILGSDNIINLYLCLLESHNFKLCNNKYPTRMTSNSQTLLDHIHSNVYNCKHRVANVINDLSDHNILILDLESSAQNIDLNVPLKTIINKCVNYSSLNIYLANNPIKFPADNIDVNKKCEVFFNYVQDAMKCHTQVFKRNEKKNYYNYPKKKWVTSAFLQLVKRKDALFSKVRKNTASEQIKNDYKALCNTITNEKRKLQSVYYRDRITNNKNAHMAWNTIKEILNYPKKKSINLDYVIWDDEIVTDNIGIANTFNIFFTQIASKLVSELPINALSDVNVSETIISKSLFLYPTDGTEVSDSISNMKARGNCSDCLNNKMLKKCSLGLSNMIADIINYSLVTGIVPDFCKLSRIVPIYKQGDPHLPMNYRPISITPVFSKLMEKVVKTRLIKHLNNNNFWYKGQYGFRPKSSTSGAVVEFMVPIQKALDDNLMAAGLFIDLKKAFDTVDQVILLHKLELAGVRGVALKWFQSFLQGRSQYVSINQCNGSHLPITIGVPQGSVLGPVLFLIFINDIGMLKLKGKMTLFADDTSLYYIAKTEEALQAQIQSDIITICDWCVVNKLTVNIDKTKFMIFHKQSYVPNCINNVTINGKLIERVNNYKFLGLIVDETLSWGKHVDYIIKKITPVIGILHRLQHKGLHRSTLRSIYFSLIQSHLSYLSIIWGCAVNHTLYPLQILQNRALRRLHALPFRTHLNELYKKTDILPIKYAIRLESLMFIHNNRHKFIFSNLYLTANKDVYNHGTRGANNLHIFPAKSVKYGKNSILYKAISKYNSLSNHMYNRPKHKLKKKLKKILMDEYISNYP